MVVPQGEYQKLYNKQYAELTTLKNKIDPEEKREKYFETAQKTHYPKVYEDVIKNNYILTNPQRIQNALDDLPPSVDYKTKKQANLRIQKQLDEVSLVNKIKYHNPTQCDS